MDFHKFSQERRPKLRKQKNAKMKNFHIRVPLTSKQKRSVT